MNLNILILPETFVQNDDYLKQLAESLVDLPQRFVILHPPVQNSAVQTWFYTKRISAKLSENMVTNLPFSAEHKNLFSLQNNQITANASLLEKNLRNVRVLVLNGVLNRDFINLREMVGALQQVYPIERNILFTQNPLSPLAYQQAEPLNSVEKIHSLKTVYPEEQSTLDLAAELIPIYLTNPQSFRKIF